MPDPASSPIDHETLALVARYTDNLVVITDACGHIVWVNDSFVRIAGYAADEVIGRKPGSFLQGPGTDPATVSHMRGCVAEGRGFDVEILNYARDGRPYWLEVHVSPIRDAQGVIQRFVAIERDITARRRDVDELRAANELALAAAAKLRGVEQLREMLTNTLVHDLRSPLMAMQMVAEAMAHEPTLTADTRGDVVAMQGTIGALGTLVNSILEAVRIQDSRLPLRLAETRIDQIAREAIDQVRGMRLGTRVALSSDSQATITCDAGLIRRVFANLVSNALKHAPDSSEVVVSLRDEDGLLRVSVADRGPGIAPEHHQRIFEAFGALAPRAGHSTGLGLPFCKLAVEAHGGLIGVESAPGHGSVFWFTLPRSPEASSR